MKNLKDCFGYGDERTEAIKEWKAAVDAAIEVVCNVFNVHEMDKPEMGVWGTRREAENGFWFETRIPEDACGLIGNCLEKATIAGIGFRYDGWEPEEVEPEERIWGANVRIEFIDRVRRRAFRG
jgi:hypothetical protein